MEQRLRNHITLLCRLGISLSNEQDHDLLLENILLGIKELTNADAGTLYLLLDKKLEFAVVRTSSLNIAMGGTTGKPVNFPGIPLYINDQANDSLVVAYAALYNKTVNIVDAYQADKDSDFDFSGPKRFDASTGYHSKSFLTIPMRNHRYEVIGVLQLINAQDPINGDIIAFSKADQHLAESLASQAAVALTNKQLIDELRELFESFTRMIADAIDQKSPYTGRHCRRVPDVTMMLAEAADKATNGELNDFHMDEEQRYALELASWLHDCGKVTTPDYIMDKATKLETIFDRIHVIDLRIELMKRDAEIALLRKQMAAMKSGQLDQNNSLFSEWEQQFKKFCADLDEEFKFLQHHNIGGEFMPPNLQNRVAEIGKRNWLHSQKGLQELLNAEEIKNMQVSRGTLTYEERQIINHHIIATIDMLEALPFPKHLRNVPEYACGHHERMDGRGYPRGLKRHELSIPARVMAIADVFEALTSSDRPYKKAKTITEALFILGKMKEDNHIDPDLFDAFIRQKVYMRYAKKHLNAEQIDEVDETKIPGYVR
ncbi:MAG: HD domain-containing phosphohydrolase [Mariprofundales bacterium]